MTTMMKAIALFLYEILFDANPFDQARKQEALHVQDISSMAA